uniref:DUF4055 domain-containing protein n=1 Tax=viral metagenome TaxID=1070528 RepID=A0A6M3LGY1_9ZZZZ
MPSPRVNTRHAEYDARAAQWERCRDVLAGSDAVKAAGTRYLPRLSGQDDPEYAAYQLRADWYGATDRTLTGLAGAIFRRDPQVVFPESDLGKSLLKDLSWTGLSLTQMAYQACKDILGMGRCFLYVDHSLRPEGRPYVVRVEAENVINWSTAVKAERLEWVVIEESYEEFKGGDRYQVERKTQWRVLELSDPPGPRVYNVAIYRKNENRVPGADEFVEVSRTMPRRRGQTLDFIPGLFLGPNDLSAAVEKSPLLDLVDVNLSHYRTSADLEHGRHYVGLPTPWVAGFPHETKLRIGSNVAWVTDDPNGKVGMLEFTGQGLGALEKALEHKEKLMAVLGARLLEEQKKGAEAAATVQLRQSSETATLMQIIQVLEDAFTRVLGWVAWWAGLASRPDDPKISLTLNRDLVAKRATPEEIAALVQALQGGTMAFETVYANMEELELTREGVSAEDELTAIRGREEEVLGDRVGVGVQPADQVRIARTVEEVAQRAAGGAA